MYKIIKREERVKIRDNVKNNISRKAKNKIRKEL